VSDGWELWQSKAAQFQIDANTFLSELMGDSFELTPVSTEILFNPTATLGTPFNTPTAPVAPNIIFAEQDPPVDPTITVPVWPTLDTSFRDSIQARLQTMMAGGTGLPDAVWDAIWNRSISRETEAGLRSIQEANEEWASRGFSIPPGALVNQVARAQAAMASAAVTLSREIAIKAAEMEVQIAQFSVQQGLALEQLISTLAQIEMQTKIAGENLILQDFASKVQRFQAVLQAESTRIEALANVYQSQSSAFSALASAEGTRVESDTRRFTASVDVTKAQADLYAKQIELQITQSDRMLSLELERIKTVNNVYAQLAAATMSAVSLSAGISSSNSQGNSCSTSYNHSF
jgi:hypothetical protein